jgi:ribonuclease HI
VTADLDRLPAETLSPLADRVDETLALYGYELGAAVEAIDDAVPGFGGLFDPGTTDDERRGAIDDVLAAGPPARQQTDPAVSEVVLYVDGSSHGNPGPAGAGAVLQAESGTLATLGRPVGSHVGNNVAEYAALTLGLEAAVGRFDPDRVEVRIDSMTVIKDVWKDDTNAVPAEPYRQVIDSRLAAIERHGWTHLADSEPNPADAQARVGADIAALGPG